MLMKIIAQNFLSFQNLELDFTSYSGNLVLIEGNIEDEEKADSNGAGKSAIIEAIVWGLFGSTIRELKSVDDVINTSAQSDCLVKIIFSINDKKYKIARYRNHSIYNHDLFLFKLGEGKKQDLRGASNKETQERITDLIGLDYFSFVNSHVFSGAANRFTSATDFERKKILQSILEIDWIDDALEKVKIDLREKEESADEWNIKLIKSKSAKEELVGLLKNMESDHLKLKRRIKDINSVLNSKINKFKNELNIEKKDLSVIEKDILKIKRKMSKIKVSNLKLDSLYLSRSNINSRVKVTSNDIAMISKKMISLHKLSEDVCPECNQKVSHKYIVNLVNELDKDKKRLINESIGNKKKLENIDHKISNYNSIKSELDRYKMQKDALVLSRSASAGIIFRIESEISSSKKEANILSKEIKENFKKIIAMKGIIKKKGLDIVYNKNKLNKFNIACDYLRNLSVVFGKDGLRVFMFNHLVPLFNKKANYYLSLLASDMYMEFSTSTELKSGKVSDKFDVKVIKRKGANSYAGLSTGQKRKADVAIVPALRSLYMSVGKDMGLVFYDEIFDSLDSSGIDSVIDMLSKETGTRFVISHRNDLRDHFKKVITVNKKNGVSFI